MKIIVKVIPNAKKNKVLKEENKIKIYVTVPAIDGKANKSAIKLLSDFLKVKKSEIKIIKGEKTKEKVIMISNNKE